MHKFFISFTLLAVAANATFFPLGCDLALGKKGFLAQYYKYPFGSQAGISADFFGSGHASAYLGSISNIFSQNYDISWDANIESGWGKLYGFPITTTNYTMALSGMFKATMTGVHKFTLDTDCGASFQFGAKAQIAKNIWNLITPSFLINQLTDLSGRKSETITMHLEKGQAYPVKIVLLNSAGPNSFSLSFKGPDMVEVTDVGSHIFQLTEESEALEASPSSIFTKHMDESYECDTGGCSESVSTFIYTTRTSDIEYFSSDFKSTELEECLNSGGEGCSTYEKEILTSLIITALSTRSQKSFTTASFSSTIITTSWDLTTKVATATVSETDSCEDEDLIESSSMISHSQTKTTLIETTCEEESEDKLTQEFSKTLATSSSSALLSSTSAFETLTIPMDDITKPQSTSCDHKCVSNATEINSSIPIESTIMESSSDEEIASPTTSSTSKFIGIPENITSCDYGCVSGSTDIVSSRHIETTHIETSKEEEIVKEISRSSETALSSSFIIFKTTTSCDHKCANKTTGIVSSIHNETTLIETSCEEEIEEETSRTLESPSSFPVVISENTKPATSLSCDKDYSSEPTIEISISHTDTFETSCDEEETEVLTSTSFPKSHSASKTNDIVESTTTNDIGEETLTDCVEEDTTTNEVTVEASSSTINVDISTKCHDKVCIDVNTLVSVVTCTKDICHELSSNTHPTNIASTFEELELTETDYEQPVVVTSSSPVMPIEKPETYVSSFSSETAHCETFTIISTFDVDGKKSSTTVFTTITRTHEAAMKSVFEPLISSEQPREVTNEIVAPSKYTIAEFTAEETSKSTSSLPTSVTSIHVSIYEAGAGRKMIHLVIIPILALVF